MKEESERRKKVKEYDHYCLIMNARNSNRFTLTTLKDILREMNLPTSGKKVELVNRLMEADPGKWIKNARTKEGTEESIEEEDSSVTKRELEILERETNVARREAALLERELQAAREEIERMRANANATD